jgi:hypothetical protein
MTREMDAIWNDAKDSIQYREEHVGTWRFSTSYHGSSRFALVVDKPGLSTTYHMDRDELTTLGTMIAHALGGDLYDPADDCNSEIVPGDG